MQISVGDEGGTTSKAPVIPQSAQTARAAQRPSFSFDQVELMESMEKPTAEMTREERSQIKKELTQSLAITEEKN